MSSVNSIETTEDLFLTDKLLIRQPKQGFRAGTDSLLLSAAIPARAGDSTIELGAGVGVVSLALAARVPNLDLTLVEIDAAAVSLGRHNIQTNQGRGGVTPKAARVVHRDAMRSDLFKIGTLFDHSFCNPPFFDVAASRASDHPRANSARRSSITIASWVMAMVRWTKSNGSMTMICRARSTIEVLSALQRPAGAIELIPILPQADQPAINVIIRARKDRRAAFKVLPPLIVRDQNHKISPKIERIQRFGNDQL